MPIEKHLVHLDSYKNRRTNEYFDCQFPLNQTYKNVKCVKLMSLEMPIGFYNIHEGINEFCIYIEGIFYSFFIPIKTYNTIQEIVEAVNESIPKSYRIEQTSPFANYWDVVVTYNNETKEISVSAMPDIYHYYQSSDWYVIDNPLSNLILDIYSTAPKSTLGSRVNNNKRSNINIDNYLSMHIEQIGTNSNSNRTTFKVPLSLSTNAVLYLCDHIFYAQEIYCDTTLNTLNIKFYDRFNNLLSNNGYSWSATLEFTCEID